MEIVYIFCRSDAIRIPIFVYDRHLFNFLVSVGGGVWDAYRQEFVFGRDVPSDRFRIIALYLPFVWVDTNSPRPLSSFGFLESRDKIAESCLSPCHAEQVGMGKPHSRKKKPCLSTDLPETNTPVTKPASLTDAIFPVAPPERLSEYWQNKLEAELRSRKYSPQTRRCYLYYNRLLCRTLQKPPEKMHPDDITHFLASVEKDREYSASSINLAISAIKFFYNEVLKSGIVTEQHRPRHDGRLPQVLSKEEIVQLLDMEKNPKHRLLLMLVYSSGLRVSEAVALKKEHIDLSRKVIYVKQGKGRKDRCTLLS